MIRTALRFITMWNNQWKKPAELESLQLKSLKSLILHSYTKVPYYRQLFDTHKLKPEDIRTLDDIKKIPLLTKEIIRKIPVREFIADGTDLEKCSEKKTSGSTGTPTRVYSAKDDKTRKLLEARLYFTNGVRPIDRIVQVLHPSAYPKDRFFFQKLGIYRKEYISQTDLPHVQALQLLKINPDVISCIPLTLKLIAEEVKKQRGRLNLRIAFTNGELMGPELRECLKKSLGCDIIDYYGSVEVGTCAWECSRHEGYHINMDTHYVEVINKHGKEAVTGEEGNIVVTPLYNFVMPLLRYSIGDIVTKGSQCSCNRGFRTIGIIKGRNDDFIRLKDRIIAPMTFGAILAREFGENIDQFRVVQESMDILRVYIVQKKEFGKNTNALKRRLKEVTGIDVDIRFVQEIKKEKSGKIRRIISLVK